MFVIGEFIVGIANVLGVILGAYKWVIIIAAVVSWVSPDPYNPVVRFLYAVTEPVLRPIRRLIGHRLGPIDISPLIVIIVIIFLQSFLVRSLVKLGVRMGGG